MLYVFISLTIVLVIALALLARLYIYTKIEVAQSIKTIHRSLYCAEEDLKDINLVLVKEALFHIDQAQRELRVASMAHGVQIIKR